MLIGRIWEKFNYVILLFLVILLCGFLLINHWSQDAGPQEEESINKILAAER